jgi:hypothetical protein
VVEVVVLVVVVVGMVVAYGAVVVVILLVALVVVDVVLVGTTVVVVQPSSTQTKSACMSLTICVDGTRKSTLLGAPIRLLRASDFTRRWKATSRRMPAVKNTRRFLGSLFAPAAAWLRDCARFRASTRVCCEPPNSVAVSTSSMRAIRAQSTESNSANPPPPELANGAIKLPQLAAPDATGTVATTLFEAVLNMETVPLEPQVGSPPQ